MSTLSKKEIEEPDRFMQMMTACMAYMETHKKKIVIGVVIVVALTAAAIGWYLYDKRQETLALKLYNVAFSKAVGMNAKTPSKLEDVLKAYSEVIEKHPGTRAATIASYQVASIYLRTGEIDKAIQFFDGFLKSSGSRGELTKYAYSGLGYCYVSKKDYAKALDMYQKAVQNAENNVFSGTVYYEMAGIYELQRKKAEALKHYKLSMDQTLDPMLKALIKKKIAELS